MTLGTYACPLETQVWERLLQDLSVELQKGQSLLVVGQSGCGKSSILRAIAGALLLMHPTIHGCAESMRLCNHPYAFSGRAGVLGMLAACSDKPACTSHPSRAFVGSQTAGHIQHMVV